ncbi:MAG: Hpt domain-containing protein [Nitrospiraceae bacterium]|nr:MAG: Hpt domain-containing protein [Nitrospiraceae bacterium]
MERMEDAWQRQDMPELANIGHWLKGSGGTVGYDALTEPASKLEAFARSGRVEEAGRMLEEVKSMVKFIVPPAVENEQEAAKKAAME